MSKGWDRINMGCQTNQVKIFLILDILQTAEVLFNFVETKFITTVILISFMTSEIDNLVLIKNYAVNDTAKLYIFW